MVKAQALNFIRIRNLSTYHTRYNRYKPTSTNRILYTTDTNSMTLRYDSFLCGFSENIIYLPFKSAKGQDTNNL